MTAVKGLYYYNNIEEISGGESNGEGDGEGEKISEPAKPYNENF